MNKTLYDKLWQEHIVRNFEGSNLSLIYIDRHLIHEVTSPQAFDGMRLNSRPIWRTESNLAVVDHNVATVDRHLGIKDKISRQQIEALETNTSSYKIKFIDLKNPFQGIVHVIGPELGATLPGMTVVCGDSHTSTHGALSALLLAAPAVCCRSNTSSAVMRRLQPRLVRVARRHLHLLHRHRARQERMLRHA
mgnify:CR=1 FL=1